MQSEERDQSEESAEHEQPMERPRISNTGTGVDSIETSLTEKAMYMDNIENYWLWKRNMIQARTFIHTYFLHSMLCYHRFKQK